MAQKYNATAIPQTVIIDPNGTVVRLFIGGGPQFEGQLRDALREVLEAEVAKQPHTLIIDLSVAEASAG